MSMTVRRHARLEAPTRPRQGRRRRRRGVAAVVAGYLAATFLLLAVLYAAAGDRGGPVPPAPAWDYQRETVALQGGGALNAYARWAVRATAWLTREAIERQRDVHRLSPLDHLAGRAAAASLARWRQAHRLPLEGASLAAVLALAAAAALRRSGGRAAAALLLLLVGAVLLVTRPQAATRLAGAAGVAVPDLVERAAGAGGAEAGRRLTAGRYWTAFVAEPLSRLQTGTTVLASAPPTAKAGLLGAIRGRARAAGDWAVGRHGAERAVIASLALAYVLPSALLEVALAALAACAQSLLWLLGLAGPLVVPLALLRRGRGPLLRFWLGPLAAAAGLLALTALAALLVVRAAELLHAVDTEVGLLLAGSTAPLVAAVLLARRLLRRRPPRPRVVVVRGGVA